MCFYKFRNLEKEKEAIELNKKIAKIKKVCVACQKPKPINMFGKNNKTVDRLGIYCIDCMTSGNRKKNNKK